MIFGANTSKNLEVGVRNITSVLKNYHFKNEVGIDKSTETRNK